MEPACVQEFEDVKIYDNLPTKWTASQTFTGSALVIFIYLTLTTKILPAFMKHRQPYRIKNLLLAYNAFQVAFSGYIVIVHLQYILKSNVIITRCPKGSELHEVVDGTYRYFLAKHIDLLDTVFFVLRKKDEQVTFLHLYHHAAMLTWTWFLIYHITDNFVVVGMLNSFVHVLMYAYYGISSLGPEYAKYVWWKKHLTKVQLVQFILMVFAMHYQQKLSPCPIPSFVHYCTMIVIISFFLLFINFYIQRYLKEKLKKLVSSKNAME